MGVETIGFREPLNPVPVITTSASCSRISGIKLRPERRAPPETVVNVDLAGAAPFQAGPNFFWSIVNLVKVLFDWSEHSRIGFD